IFTATRRQAALNVLIPRCLRRGSSLTLVGLSPALGTFLAGVVLANSEFRHELESDIEPFKGLLLGLFFITVGAGINFGLLFDDFTNILGLTLGLMLLKAVVLLLIATVFKMRLSDKWLFSLGLAQACEFGFVLLAFSVQSAVIPVDLADKLLLIVALSMMFTPALFIIYDKVILPMVTKKQGRKDDEIATKGTAIIAGHGRFGQIINRALMASGYKTVVIDQHAELIEGMRKFGIEVFYGDASRPDLLHAAGLHEAKLLVVAIDDAEQAIALVEHARMEHPDLHIIARAKDRNEVYKLYYAGASDIVRETFDSSVRAAGYALKALGVHPHEVEKSMVQFVEHDRKSLRDMASVWKADVDNFENEELLAMAKDLTAELEELMHADKSELSANIHGGWVPPNIAAQNVANKIKAAE
ncbi:MAG: NAD-binding protein, partial [Rhizobiales bacterium]|nr:NAD-binding protein [Hyphomicrobiales bacterium]